ncbi:MAG: Ig domain-containing protein [Gemmatimonadetes bacterium]|nr:Ig domain-containing protein [Gemmatimonadota bacterium]
MRKRVWGVAVTCVVVACGGGGGGEASGPITPPPAVVASVVVDPGSVSVLVGATVALTATAKDAAGGTLNGRAIAWSSSDAGTATVSSSGVVTAIAPGGPVTITATSEGKSGSALVTVRAAVASVSVSPAAVNVRVGESATLAAAVLDATGTALAGRSVTWTSSNPALASVSPTGLITGVAAGGPVAITATSEGRAGIAQVTVLAPVATVSVNPTELTLLKGAAETLGAMTLDATGGALTARTVTWTSSEPSIATVSPSGLVTAVAAGGPITITATSEGKSGTSPVTVLEPVVTVTLAPAQHTLFIGSTASSTVTLLDATGKSLSGRIVTWTSSDPSIASVSASGLITALSTGGPVAVTATSEGKSATVQVSVLAPVFSLELAPTPPTAVAGSTVQLSATLRDAQNRVISGRAIAWTSSNPTLASVSTNGLVTARSPGGPVTITATSEGKSGSTELTVLAPVASVTVTGSQRVKVGDSYTYSATARTADGTIVVRPLVWSVADPATGSMLAHGELVPLRPGTIILRATIDGTVWEASTVAYDWVAFGSGTTVGIYLSSDTRITNKFGTSEYPTLAIGCSSGSFLMYVDTDHFVTHSGFVAYSFDGGSIFTQTWLEFDLFSALGHPGPSQSTRTLVTTMTQARTFGFAFTEFNASAKAMIFRVTGIGPKIAPLLTACPSASSSVASLGGDAGPLSALLGASGRASAVTAERTLREQAHAAVPAARPSLAVAEERLAIQQAKRTH